MNEDQYQELKEVVIFVMDLLMKRLNLAERKRVYELRKKLGWEGFAVKKTPKGFEAKDVMVIDN